MLATPIAVDANAAEKIGNAAEQAGILSLIIDALPVHMPRLAVLLATSRSAVSAWWEWQDVGWRTRALATAPSFDEFATALAAIVESPEFSRGFDDLTDLVSVATAKFSAMRKRLIAYHRRLFADVAMARREVGQPLAPQAASAQHVSRRRFVREMDEKLSSGDAVLFVVGEEGVGKSWLVG